MQDDNDIIRLINTTQDSKPAIKRTRFINITMASSRNMYSICSSLASSEENYSESQWFQITNWHDKYDLLLSNVS